MQNIINFFFRIKFTFTDMLAMTILTHLIRNATFVTGCAYVVFVAVISTFLHSIFTVRD